MTRWPDITGKKFGLLTVLSRAGKTPAGQRTWHCSCDCGGETIASTSKLTGGKKISCGCRQGRATHGHTRGRSATPTFSSWAAMIERCKSSPYYKRLGVTVCDRWARFENFLADMGERPSMEHTLDRYPDKLGGYEPKNCRWATKKQQGNNRVTTRDFIYKGGKVTLSELAEKSGLSYERLRHRIVRAGWSVEQAIADGNFQGQRVNRRT